MFLPGLHLSKHVRNHKHSKQDMNRKFSTFHPTPDKGGENSRQTLQSEACCNCESECSLKIA